MINQDWWFTTLLIKQFKYCPPLNQDIRCDVLIVGGGFAASARRRSSSKRATKLSCWRKISWAEAARDAAPDS